MPEEHVKRRLAAIFSADVKDYSRLMRADEPGTVRMLNASREVMTRLIRQHHGRVVDSPGDNILAEFASVFDGVQAAVAIQKEFRFRNAKLPPARRMAFRIGINLGDVIVEDDRIYGDGVNTAARLESLADPGGICISRTAYDQIEDKLPLGYQYLGEHTVKNFPRPIRAYKVIIESQDIPVRVKRWTAEKLRSWKPRVREARGSGAEGKLSGYSNRKRLPALILCLVFGIFGAHRFYAGKFKSGRLMAFTIGGFGLWYLVDCFVVLFGGFTDSRGKKIRRWL